MIEYVVMSRSFYGALSDADRRAIDRAAHAMIRQQRFWYRAEADSALTRLRDEGVRISSPDREPFRAAARVVYEDWADRVGGMDRIRAIIQQAEGR